MFPLPVSGQSLGLGILLAELLLALFDPALGLPGLSAACRALVEHGMSGWFQMGHACHVGGVLAGWLFGRWLMRSRVTLDHLRRARAAGGELISRAVRTVCRRVLLLVVAEENH
jgi:membrane associated rhomboid family serine protease